MSNYVDYKRYILLLLTFSVLSLLSSAIASSVDSNSDINNYQNNGDLSLTTSILVKDSRNDELNPTFLRSLTSSDDITIQIHNVTYASLGYVLEDFIVYVTCTIRSKNLIDFSRNIVSIVPSSFNNRTDNISSVKNYADSFRILESFNGYGGVINIRINSENLLGPNYLGSCDTPSRWSCDGLDEMLDRRQSTNVSIYDPNWNRMKVIVQADLVVIGMSQRFTVSYQPIMGRIEIDSKDYFPGQYIDAKFSSNGNINEIVDQDVFQGAYLKIYKVPRSYKDDPTKFNTSPVAKYVEFWQSKFELITWSHPGLYQMVLFSFHNETVLAISDTFTVKQITDPERSKTNITVDKVSYSHLDPISITISQGPKAPSIKNGGNMMVAFFPYNANVSEKCYLLYGKKKGGYRYTSTGDEKREYYTQNFIWNATTRTGTSMTYTGTNYILNPGWYRAIVYVGSNCDARRLGSTYFRVKRPDIKVILSKRNYTQYEKTNFSLVTPYSYLVDRDVNFLSKYYSLHAIPINADPETIVVRVNGFAGIANLTGYLYSGAELSVEPGAYRVILTYNEPFNVTVYLMTISNTTFVVS